ncbi:MAG: response regulator transcription factor [Lachnospiraceae bacterium]|nr:response regulator transcription factor [Lachnospiraceae bacterium]
MLHILIVDDDCLVAASLKTILESDSEIAVDALGADGSDAVTLYAKHKPDILLMDIQMKHMSGLDAATEILTSCPDAKILLLTTFSDDEYIIKALKIGVKGYLLKQDYQSLIPAIHAVCSGQNVFGSKIVSKLPDMLAKSNAFSYESYHITDREFDVIRLVAEGLSNREIAKALFLSEGTIRNYLSQILEKLELRDRTQLAVFYYQHR